MKKTRVYEPLSCMINCDKIWVQEYKFHDTRKWRFDFACPELKIAVEIDGGLWIMGRHSRGYGIIKDNEKFNTAGLLGWRIFKFSPQQWRNGEAENMMKNVLQKS